MIKMISVKSSGKKCTIKKPIILEKKFVLCVIRIYFDIIELSFTRCTLSAQLTSHALRKYENLVNLVTKTACDNVCILLFQ